MGKYKPQSFFMWPHGLLKWHTWACKIAKNTGHCLGQFPLQFCFRQWKKKHTSACRKNMTVQHSYSEICIVCRQKWLEVWNPKVFLLQGRYILVYTLPEFCGGEGRLVRSVGMVNTFLQFPTPVFQQKIWIDISVRLRCLHQDDKWEVNRNRNI